MISEGSMLNNKGSMLEILFCFVEGFIKER